MNYAFIPSLGHMALVAIAVSLWNQNNALTFILSYYLSHRCHIGEEKWQRMEGEISEKISQLPLADILKKYIMGCIKPIGLHILKWLQVCSDSGIKIDSYLLNELCWTANGTVDSMKTAKCLIKNENLNIYKRYELACVYCFENDIQELWDKIPKIHRKSYKSIRDSPRNKLALLWTYDMKGQLDRLVNIIETHWNTCRGDYIPSPYQFAFEHSALSGNRVGAEHFQQKLSSRERKESLGRVVKKAVRIYKWDIFWFLLPQMDEDQLLQVYQSVPRLALECFLEWPFQNLFLEVASKVWDFISPDSYECVLKSIVQKIGEGYTDYDYQTLFENFWKESPAVLKTFVLDKCVYGNLLTDLSRIKDVKITTLILSHAIEEVRDRKFFVPQHKNRQDLPQ